MSGSDQALSSSSVDSRSRKAPVESIQDPIATQTLKSSARLSGKSTELLKDECIIALHATDHAAFYVSRKIVKGGEIRTQLACDLLLPVENYYKSIDEWRLVNYSNPSTVLDHVYIEVLETSYEYGIVHALTSYVISYVKFLYDYQATLKQLFQEFDPGDPEAQLASVTTRICNADYKKKPVTQQILILVTTCPSLIEV
ncbi:hypothetical protein RYX36_037280 [Vicia faba]